MIKHLWVISFYTLFAILGFIVMRPEGSFHSHIDSSYEMMEACSDEFSNIVESYDPLNECGDAAAYYFSADVGSISNIQVEINLPIGFNFEGNVIGANILSDNPLILIPTITQFGIDFSFEIQAPCDATDDETIGFDFNYDGASTECVHESLPLTVQDISLIIAPPGTPGRNTEPSLLSVLNQTDTLTTTLVQEGVGVIDSVFFYLESHDLLALDKVILCSTGEELDIAFVDGDRTYFWIGEDAVGGDGFVRNEGIDVCSIWEVLSCPGASIDPLITGIASSCELDPLSSICDEDNFLAALDFGELQPEIYQYVNLDTGFDPDCPGVTPKLQSWFLVNEGEAPLGSLELSFSEFGAATAIDITSLQFMMGVNGPLSPFEDDGDSTDIISEFDDNLPGCVSSLANSVDLKSRFELSFTDIFLAVGDTLQLDYLVYPFPCSCSNCDIRRQYGVEIDNVNAYDLCGNLVQTQTLRSDVMWPSFNVNFSSFMESPLSNCFGETSTFSTTITSYTNDFLSNQGNSQHDDNERTDLYDILGGRCTTCYLEMEFEIPNGLDVVLADPIYWIDDDGTQWIPDVINYADLDGGTDILTLRWTGQAPSGFDPFNEASNAFFNYTPDCVNELAMGAMCAPVVYDDVISKTVRFGYENCADCPAEQIECAENINVSIKCPGTLSNCDCAGFSQAYADAFRLNLYEPDPDNDREPDVGSAYDETLLRRDRFVKGDSIQVNLGGVVRTNATHPSFDYLYATVHFPNPNFIPLGGELEIFEADGTYHSCDVLTQTIEAGDILLTDLSIMRLSSNNCSTPVSYEEGDSIALSIYYQYTEDFQGDIQFLTHETNMFLSDEAYGGAQYNCGLNYDYRMSQVGIQQDFRFFTNTLNNFGGCQTGTTYYRGYARIGSAHVDYFPGEYFSFVNHISAFRANIPTGMDFNYFRVYIRRKNAGGANSLGGRINNENYIQINASHPAITIVGNQMFFDFDTYIQNQYGGQIPYSDEGYSFSLQPYFIATCDLMPGPVQDVEMEVDHVTNSQVYCSSFYTEMGSRTNLNYSGGAELIVEAIEDCVTVDQFPTCATIRVTNQGSGLATNSWLSIQNASGYIIFESLSQITGNNLTPISSTSFNVFELGSISANSSRLYQLCVNPNICDTDSIEIVAGYDCMSYPSVIEEAKCSSIDKIEYKTDSGSISILAKAPGQDLVLDDLCDTVEYVVDISASGPGYMDDVLFSLSLPLGMELVPGSFEIAYPTTASSTTLPPDSEYDLVNDPTHLYGTTYELNVTDEDLDFPDTGLIGSEGSAFNLNVVNIRFQASTTCGYAAGSRVFYQASAEEGCGDQITPFQKDFSVKTGIFQAAPPFVSEVQVEADTLEACVGESSTLSVEYSINGATATATEDSLRIILPAGINFVPNSYIFGANASADPPVIQIESGLEVLYWSIEGLTPGTTAVFSIDIQAMDIGQACTEYPLYVQTFKSSQAYCDATDEVCLVRSLSDESTEFIQILKPELEVLSSSAVSMLMGTDELVMFEFTVQNVGSVASSMSNVVWLDIYNDVDGDGRYTEGVDILLGSINDAIELGINEVGILEGELLIPVDQTCNMLAVLDVTKNCACSSSSSTQIQSELDLKIDIYFEVCSNEIIEFGPEPTPGFEYEWLSLNGSDLLAIQTPLTETPASFQFDNNTGQDIYWSYGLRILRAPGCYHFDSIDLRIFPETFASSETSVCGPISGCDMGPFSFDLNGPTQGSDYEWSVVSGDMSAVIDPTDMSNATVSTLISETTTFRLDYLDLNSCPAIYEQEVSLQNCACTSLGDTVWYDFNIDGIQDLNEPGIEGVTVHLYDASDLTVPIASTMTDANGYYIFEPLPQGNYVLQFDPSSYTGVYGNLIPTLVDVGSDLDDSDADPITGFTDSYFLPNGISNLTIDAGFYPKFDLALTKTINTNQSPGPYFPLDTVHYVIRVMNQGAYYEARNILVTDYLPGDLSFYEIISGPWLSDNGNPVIVTDLGSGSFELDILNPTDAVEIEMRLVVSAGAMNQSIVNYAEIADFENDYDLNDFDSEADQIDGNDAGGASGSQADDYVLGDGTGTPGDTSEVTDEDDHDPAVIRVENVDLALRKTIDQTYNPEPIPVGEMVKFDIEVINQGEVSVDSVLIMDYIPGGYIFDPLHPLNVAEGWNASAKTFLRTRLNTGDRATVSIYLEVVYDSDPSSYINASEIMAAYDTVTGRDVSIYDIDSDPGSNTPEESGTPPHSAGDNYLLSTDLNDIGSEDDHDIETIEMVHVDVALIKQIDPMYDLTNLNYGDSIKFLITVINQGTIDASLIELVDYLPIGLNFDPSIPSNSIWTVQNSTQVETTITNLVRGTQQSVCIWLRLMDVVSEDSWLNVAEITSFTDLDGVDRSDEDIDSDLDDDPDNNGGGEATTDSDDSVVGDGSGMPGDDDALTDEDNSDPALVEIFDLALRKSVESTGPFAYGDTIRFKIKLFNQGNVSSTQITVIDTIASGFYFDPTLNPFWNSVSPSKVEFVLTDTLELGEMDSIYIDLVLQHSSDPISGFVNYAEISDALDLDGNPGEDIDSDADDNVSNDIGGDPYGPTDDLITDNGAIDEDDHDPAFVEIYDLALIKRIMGSGPYTYGDTVVFEFEVFNQGNVPAQNIRITEYTPCGYTYDLALNDPDWQLINGNLEHLITTTILPGDSEVVSLRLVVQQCVDPGSHMNMGEISAAEDDQGNDMSDADIDSDPDAINGNDGTPNDDNILNEDDDEDDHDIAKLLVFDLALKKQVVTQAPYQYGQLLEFDIIVMNQGDVNATQIEVVDSLPAGFGFDPILNPLWDDSMTPDLRFVSNKILTPGESDTITIYLTLQPGDFSAGAYVNYAEIFSAEDEDGNMPDDIDSNPDNDVGNDTGGEPGGATDDVFDDNGVADEDDHDPAVVEIFDLALTKVITSSGPFQYGDTVMFEFEVYNQGSIAAQNVTIAEYTPCGYTYDSNLNDPIWDMINGELYHTTQNPIYPGQSRTVPLMLILQPCLSEDAYENIGEIMDAEDMNGNDMSPMDIDSNTDSDPGNDGLPNDNEVGNQNGDEDDHDPAMLAVFDLALQKTANQTVPATIGTVHEFIITVHNQGNETAQNVLISDYIPNSLSLAAAGNGIWTSVNPNLATTLITTPIPPLSTHSVSIFLEVIGTDPIEMVNMAEISMAEDDMGNDMTLADFDSTADGLNTNDNGNEPFSHLDDNLMNEGGDEDDHDQAALLICDDLTCHGHLNVSLDENCSAAVTPAMFLTGIVYPASMYDLEIMDAQGNVVDSIFDPSDLGMTFTYTIILPLCDNISCWGEFTVEDKFAPTIMCMDSDIACNVLSTVADPIVMDNCGADLVLLSEVHENLDCDLNYNGRVIRTWQAVDAYGNVSPSCTQTINLERIDLSAIVFPPTVNISFACDGGFPTDSNGNPDPSVTGVPTYLGQPLWPMVPPNFCNGFASYTDSDVLTSSCHRQIMRVWQVGEWWCGMTVGPMNWVQMIDLLDQTGPVLTCPSDMTVSTTPNNYSSCSTMVVLPTAPVTDNCSEPIEVDVQFPGGFLDNRNGGLVELPVGVHTITYFAYDDCLNSSSCTMQLTVEDGTQPIAICEQFTTVSIGSSGLSEVLAEAFDDGSYDNCGIEEYLVRRMDDACGITGNTIFSDRVSFCCADVNTQVVIVFRVVDTSGNVNDCMVTASVQDKINPVLTCPPDMTVECTTNYDLNNLSVFFGEPEVSDNCQTALDVEEDYEADIDQCGIGVLRRMFSLTANDGAELTCTQEIHFENSNPIMLSDIDWPEHYEGEGCGIEDVDPEDLPVGMQYPIIDDGSCDLTGYQYVDEVFDFVEGENACMKIIRHWTVIDWCQTGLPSWTYDQVIKIEETSIPEFTSDMSDLEVESYDADCAVGDVPLIAMGTDACTPEESLQWSYEIDMGIDGTIDFTGQSNDASGTYDVGEYLIRWEIHDRCGNTADTTQIFRVVSVKAPTPICINGLSSALIGMDTDGDGTDDAEMVVLTPDFFDGGSHHPCGYGVTLSFDEAGAVTELVFDCDDIGMNTIELWVTDDEGNAAYCETFIEIIDDNDTDICPENIMGGIGGELRMKTGEALEGVEVELEGGELTVESEEEGEYWFGEMPLGGAYKIIPYNNEDPMNGVSTLDLVLIQKHILGLGELEDVYSMIAGDVNKDGELTAIDLLELRKMILGIYEEFPNNTSWRYIDKGYEFVDEEDPWVEAFPEDYEIGELTGDMWIDFVGIKTGDVNGSVDPNIGESLADTRNQEYYPIHVLIKERNEGSYTMDVQATAEDSWHGIQMSLKIEGAINSEIEIEGDLLDMNQANYHLDKTVDGRNLNISWNTQDGQLLKIEKGAKLFSIRCKSKERKNLHNSISLQLNTEGITSELYSAEGEKRIDLSIERQDLLEEDIKAELVPNPWSDVTRLFFEQKQKGISRLTIYNTQGEKVYEIQRDLDVGNHVWEITREKLSSSGVYNYELQLPQVLFRSKMIVIK